MKPKIAITLVRTNGHSTKAATAPSNPPSEDMIDAADALIEYISTGKDPRAACGSCGIRRDKHQVRHIFVEDKA